MVKEILARATLKQNLIHHPDKLDGVFVLVLRQFLAHHLVHRSAQGGWGPKKRNIKSGAPAGRAARSLAQEQPPYVAENLALLSLDAPLDEKRTIGWYNREATWQCSARRRHAFRD